MVFKADILHRAIDMMEDALMLLDSINASHAGALLDHAIHAARDLGGITDDRQPSHTNALVWKDDMSSFNEAGASGISRLIQDPDHPLKADRT